MILDALFRLAREFPGCVAQVAGFLINNQEHCHNRSIKQRITKWIRGMLNAHLPHGHDFEVAWCLVICGVLKITVRRTDIAKTGTMPHPVVLAVLGLLREHNLLTVPLSTWRWRGEFKNDGIYGQNWLPFYEAVLRRWTTASNSRVECVDERTEPSAMSRAFYTTRRSEAKPR